MKFKFLLSASALLLASGSYCYAQGLIVNEISQGPSGSKEYIELLVVGSETQTTGNVDISDWIIDDNNGDFTLSDGTAPGIATGHFRFVANATTQNMPIGSIIVLYNSADKNSAWEFPVIQNGKDVSHTEINSAGTNTYYIPGTSDLLLAVSGTPSNNSTSYAYTNSNTPPLGQNWTGELGLANSGDAIQIRRPGGIFYHGFGFSTPAQSDPFTGFPTFPEVNLPSFNASTGSASGKVTYFTCGSWYFATPYLSGDADTEETPGEPNNPDNADLIKKIQSGTFDYSLLGTDVTCSQVLPLTMSTLSASLASGSVVIAWTMESEFNNDSYIIERSLDQSSWKEIGRVVSRGNSSVEQHYKYMDHDPAAGKNYYRIIQVDRDGKKLASPVVSVKTAVDNAAVKLFPNPVTGESAQLSIGQPAVSQILISDMTGRVVYRDDTRYQNQTIDIPVSGWARGVYLIRLRTGSTYQTIKLIKK